MTMEEERAHTVAGLRTLANKIEANEEPVGLFLAYTDGEGFGGDMFTEGVTPFTVIGVAEMQIHYTKESLWEGVRELIEIPEGEKH